MTRRDLTQIIIIIIIIIIYFLFFYWQQINNINTQQKVKESISK